MKVLLQRYRRRKRPKTQGRPDVIGFKPRQLRNSHIVPQRASLEGVAVEIQQAILHQMPDLHTLQALISASLSYLRAYQSQRHSILSDILLRDIHPDVLFDVLAIVDALKLPRNYDDYVPKINDFVEEYMDTRSSLDVALQPLEPSTRDTLWDFHLSVIDVTKDCSDYTLSTHSFTGHSLNHRTSIPPNEVRRIHRAFYRYELFAVLFREPDLSLEEQTERHRDRDTGSVRLASERDSIRSLDTQDKSFLFFALFKAWEVEEIACIRDYITHRYDELSKECKSEVQERMGRESCYGTAPWNSSPESPSESHITLE